MAKLLPITVSSNLSVASAETSSIEIGAYENKTGKTGTAAPILLSIESERTVAADEVAALMPEKGGQGTEAQARLILNAVDAVLEELVETYGAITVQTPFGTIETFIAGSLAEPQDETDPLTNIAYLGVVEPEAIRAKFASIETYIPSATCPVNFKRIRDVATGKAVIDGTNAFYVEGYGLTYGATGETCQLLNPLTRVKVCDITVDATTKSTICWKCNIPAGTTATKGSYILAIKSKGGSDTLWPVEKVVELASDVAPEKRKIKMSTLTASMMGSTCTVETTGENFADVQNYSESGGYVTLPCKYSINGGAEVDGGFMGSPSNPLTLNISSGVSAGDTIKVTLTPDPAKIDVDQNLVEKTAVAA